MLLDVEKAGFTLVLMQNAKLKSHQHAEMSFSLYLTLSSLNLHIAL